MSLLLHGRDSPHILNMLGGEPVNLQGVRLARVRDVPIATKFRSAGVLTPIICEINKRK
jgi:hypothetical protein